MKYSDVISNIVAWPVEASNWKSKPIISHSGVPIPLHKTILPEFMSSHSPPDQPKFRHRHSNYRFPTCYHGPDARTPLVEMIRSVCDDCTLQVFPEPETQLSLRCNHYRVSPLDSSKFTDDGKLTKDDVCHLYDKQNKKRSKDCAFGRMDNSKMKHKKVTTSQSIVDRRTQNSNLCPANRRTSGQTSANNKSRCPMRITIFMDPNDSYWYLKNTSVFDHNDHICTPNTAQTLPKDDLTPEQLRTLTILYDLVVSPTMIAKLIGDSVQMSTTKKGEFLAKTVLNI